MKRNIYKDLFILISALVVIGAGIWGYMTFLKKEDKLSIKDRTIISDIILGMKTDSLEILLEQNSEKRLFSISDLSNMMSWSGRGNSLSRLVNLRVSPGVIAGSPTKETFGGK
jgi:hypothetical protein